MTPGEWLEGLRRVDAADTPPPVDHGSVLARAHRMVRDRLVRVGVMVAGASVVLILAGAAVPTVQAEESIDQPSPSPEPTGTQPEPAPPDPTPPLPEPPPESTPPPRTETPEALPDLLVTRLDPVREGGEVVAVQVTVANLGSAPARGFTVR
jgi:hypothetical protein